MAHTHGPTGIECPGGRSDAAITATAAALGRHRGDSEEAAGATAHGRAGVRDVVRTLEVIGDRCRVGAGARVPGEPERVRPDDVAYPNVIEGAGGRVAVGVLQGVDSAPDRRADARVVGGHRSL